MKQLMLMSEAAKTYMRDNNGNKIDPEAFFGLLEKCHPFVFGSGAGSISEIVPTDSDELDAPFSVFSVEMEKGHITVPLPSDKLEVFINCILASEVYPRIFEYYVLVKTVMRGKSVDSIVFFGRYAENRHVYVSICENFIKRLNSEKCGIEKIRERVKIGVGKNKRTHTFRQIIHVRPKKAVSTTSGSGREIDWQARWMVRGHWRDHKGIGKDRSGVYCVEGSTWVSEHCKGPDGKPLIRRIRMVEDE